MANLKTMSIADLLTLRSQVDAMLGSKRGELHAQLQEIGGGSSAKRGSSSNSGLTLRGSKAKPKYRHPTTGEVWSGRGGTIGWLAAEIKAGRRKEDFLISGATKKSAAKRSKRKNSRKA